MGAGAKPVAVLLVEDRAAVAGHVDSGRAVAGTSLACHTEVEGAFHLGGVPTVDEGAIDHLLEDAGAASGGVHLEPGGLVRGAHHRAWGSVGDALSDSGAAMDVGGEFRMGNGDRGKS